MCDGDREISSHNANMDGTARPGRTLGDIPSGRQIQTEFYTVGLLVKYYLSGVSRDDVSN